MSDQPTEPKGVTRWTRASLGLQVTLVVVLGLAAAALLVHVFDRPQWRGRADFTIDQRNSLDPQTVELLGALPETVEVDLFLGRPNRYLAPLVNDAVGRGLELLLVAEQVAPGQVFWRQNDLSDLAAAEARLEELGVEAISLQTQSQFGSFTAAAVLSLGERRALIRFVPDAADADWGDVRQQVLPRLLSWRGEEAFAEALAKIVSQEKPKVYLSTGHGELDAFRPDLDFGRSLVAMAEDLSSDGYEIDTWAVESEGPVPDDADVLLIGSPTDPFSEAGATALRNYLGRGGRVLLAVPERYVEDDPLFPFLTERGIMPRRGIVAQQIVDPNTGRRLDGDPRCASLRINGKDTSSDHPITRLLWERDRDLQVQFSRTFGRGAKPERAGLFDLVATPSGCWLDLPGEDGMPDFAYDGNSEERGQFRLAMAATWPARNNEGTTVEGRLVALPGSSLIADGLFPYNREFALSAMDWLADRSFRVRIPGRDPFRSRLDLTRNSGARWLLLGGSYGLPLLCLLLGGFLFFLRRR